MFRNAVMPLKMVSHEETRDVYKYENNKKVEGSQIKKTRRGSIGPAVFRAFRFGKSYGGAPGRRVKKD